MRDFLRGYAAQSRFPTIPVAVDEEEERGCEVGERPVPARL
jgi:hypothetical protein